MTDEGKQRHLENPASNNKLFQQKSSHLLCDEADFDFTID
jgi:hypothetical protein